MLIAATLVGCRATMREDDFPELARARHAGLITSIEQAERYQNFSPDDVSHLYAENASVFKSPEVISFVRASSPEEIDRLAQAAEKKIKQLEPIGRSTDFAPKRDWSKGFSMVMPEYIYVKDLEKAYCHLAQYYVRKGDTPASLRYLSYAANIVKQVSSQKLLIDKLVFTAINAIWTRNAIICAKKLWNDPAELNGLLTLTGRFPEPNYKEAFGYELATFRQSFKPVIEGKKSIADLVKEQMPFGDDSAVRAAAKGLDPVKIERLVFSRYAEVAEKWSHRDKLKSLADAASHQDAVAEEEIAALLIPVVVPAKDAELRQLAEQRCFRVAIAARLLNLETGRWPSLDAASKRAQTKAVDPFSESSLHYKTNKSSVLIYSVGPDGVDDGGLEIRRSSRVANYDAGVVKVP